jgi:hypothetical protein
LRDWVSEKVAKFKIPKKVWRILEYPWLQMLTSDVDLLHGQYAQDSYWKDSTAYCCGHDDETRPTQS